MKSKVARLRLAALVGIACTFSTAFAADPYQTFSLTWESPTANEDGSPLTDLQGYYVYVGLTPDTLLPLYFTSSATVVFGMATFPRYFAVTAINTSGLESVLSAVVSAPVVAAP
jgi:hypothetical protein